MDTKSLLRGVTDDDSLDALMDNAAAVRAVLDVLGKRLGLPRLDTPPRGSAVVGMTADVVVKMMAPHDRAHSDAEQACLTALDGALPIPTPTLLDKGELEGWSWIVMSRLRGDELVDIWPHLTGADRLSLATQLGECLGILHRLDAPTELERVDWDDWCATRIPRIEADQRKRGCPEALLQGLEILVREADTTAQRTGWLHTEVMLEHLLVEATPSGPRLSGLFDFEPSWVGPVDYEFASVGIFVSAGDPALLQEILRAAGTSPSPQRLFAMTLLHRYANLSWYQRRLGGPLDSRVLADLWFRQAAPGG